MADIIPPRRGESLTNSAGTTRFMEYLERMTDASNENTDATDILSSINANASALSSLSKKIRNLETAVNLSALPVRAGLNTGFRITAISADYTTLGNEILICTNTVAITITLNSTPKDNEEVHVVRQNAGTVTVSGAINGDTSLSIGQRYSSPHLVFTIAAGEFNII